jgi:S1-C subfamily serine protease
MSPETEMPGATADRGVAKLPSPRAAGLAATLLLAACLLPCLWGCAAPPPPDGSVTEPAATLTFPYPIARNVKFPDYEQVAEQSAGIYVRLRIFTDEKDELDAMRDTGGSSNVLSFASGFIADPRGYAVTAAHIALSTKFKANVITMEGRSFLGQVVAVDRQRELALIKFEPFAGMSAARFADSDIIEKGEPALAIGTPAHVPGVVSVGRVMNPHLDYRIAYNDFGYDNAIELAMRVDQGHSGGPIIDREGRVMGMVASLALGKSGSNAPPRPLIALAVPSNDIRAFIAAHIGE